MLRGIVYLPFGQASAEGFVAMEELRSAIHRSRSTGFGFTLCKFGLEGGKPHPEPEEDPEASWIEAVIEREKRFDDLVLSKSLGAFLVLFRNTDREGGSTASMRLQQAMADEVIGIRVSLEAAQFPEDGETTDQLLGKIKWARAESQ
jgi:hypothetical protein